uniref:Uncharacterized protein n=1 Tax=viral metagenome TaxID=1070528 RepID=A0A6C0KCZ2_9ZZZZ
MFLSIALKKPNGTSYCWMDVGSKKELEMGDDINHWIERVMKNVLNEHSIICYNDEEPGDSKATSKGHSKGVVAWNTQKIGWLIHSVPKYPSVSSSSSSLSQIEPPQLIYGQSFVYMEFDFEKDKLCAIIDQLSIMEAHIFHSKISNPSFLINIHSKKDICISPFSSKIIHIAKSSSWRKDLYEDCIYDHMKSAVLCETWAKPSSPSTDTVKNVKTIRWPNGDKYQTTQDHSKYAVSMDVNHPWVFIGDINHMESQTRRGGGGLMIQDLRLWTAIHHLFMEYTDVVSNPLHEVVRPKKWWACFECLDD